jgi:hypothetical protein
MSAPAARSTPASRLATTTVALNAPCARLISGRPDAASARTPSALIATSTAPDVAPTASSATASAAPDAASAGRTAHAANATSATGSPRAACRSRTAPAGRMATSAPAPMHSSAMPSCPSSTPAWSWIAGSVAPQAPQKAPKAAKPPSTRTRPAMTDPPTLAHTGRRLRRAR